MADQSCKVCILLFHIITSVHSVEHSWTDQIWGGRTTRGHVEACEFGNHKQQLRKSNFKISQKFLK